MDGVTKELPEPKQERTIEDRLARLERWARERASEAEKAHPSWIDAPDPATAKAEG